MGPLVSEKHMNDVLKYVELGKSEGATLVCGGYRYTEGECGKGFFVKPTIFDNCTSDMSNSQRRNFWTCSYYTDFRNRTGSH